MIAVVDCEGCQTRPLISSLNELKADAEVAAGAETVNRAEKVIIPPSVSYRRMLGSLRDRKLVGPIVRAIEDGRPVLGIGGGANLFFDISYEDSQHTGLGVLRGCVSRFDFGRHPAARHFSVPHQGWNRVHWAMETPLLRGIESGEYFYFDHCAHPDPLDPRNVAATTNHGIDFPSVVSSGNVFGTVFLPERSDAAGRTVLANFLAM